MMQSVRNFLMRCIQECGGPDCDRMLQVSGAELMQCARLVAFLFHRGCI